MEHHYSIEKSVQMLISLLKQHNIRKIVASPGTTNISFVASAMQDPWFEIYSSVDERSGCYIACGLAFQTGEPVVLSCTGATASRNYMPGLTEAFYSKLPILAITATQGHNKIGNLIAQVIDRTQLPNDVALLSESITTSTSEEEEWSNNVKINRALLALRHHGGGPVHLDFQTTYPREYSVKECPDARAIFRTSPIDPQTNPGNTFPLIEKSSKIAIFLGRHNDFSKEATESIDRFCAKYNAVVFCDHTSGYKGKYRVLLPLITTQTLATNDVNKVDLLIHIGEISGAYMNVIPQKVWRVSPDGELKDFYRKLTHVFEMEPEVFFSHYAPADETISAETSYLEKCNSILSEIRQKINPSDIPFSNIWIASQTAHRIPENSIVHLGILNTLRAWNLFEMPESVSSTSNTGGFGIDGILSTLVGASLADKKRLFFTILGDLAFFYDMNVAGNRHVGNNIRILLINNGKGTEFRNYNHLGALFGNEADHFIAAAGHYGNKSHNLVRHYAEDLGFEYITAETKEEYLTNLDRFLTPLTDDSRPILFEVFTDSEDESNALKTINETSHSAKGTAKQVLKGALGNKGIKFAKSILGK
ncbi:MAG: 2-succinyl-5-enolpyruvyl-6-hydroxy-3-cyclohexene-1-carboxylate synthase [Duncaniella sp.]|nr:2-succinyl-5-enolpyruvyl-6-hydroxy-3-cyclohexene-1-carboxylate synthase [Duncaniella sp.]